MKIILKNRIIELDYKEFQKLFPLFTLDSKNTTIKQKLTHEELVKLGKEIVNKRKRGRPKK